MMLSAFKQTPFFGLAAWLSCAFLVACSSPPISSNVTTAATFDGTATAYNGLFISNCGEMATGLYYADALELKPTNTATVQAQYFKVFFSGEHCERASQLVQLKLPMATWEVLGQAKIGEKMTTQVRVILPSGLLTGTIGNAEKVKETETAYEITFGPKNKAIPIQKQTDGSISKELRLIENNRLYMSDPDSPTSAEGFPTVMLADDFFQKH